MVLWDAVREWEAEGNAALSNACRTQIKILRRETRFDQMNHLVFYTSGLARRALEVLEGWIWGRIWWAEATSGAAVVATLIIQDAPEIRWLH